MAQPSETSSAFEIKFTSREVSAWGGMALMKRMLDSMGFQNAATQWDLPDPGSNRGYPPVQLIEQLLVSIWCGACRFTHLDITRLDNTLTRLFGWTRVAGHKAIVRLFGRFDMMRHERVQASVYRWFFDTVSTLRSITLDMDSTVITRHGEQQGAARGYNPNKRGRLSHHPLLAFVAEARMVANFWLRPGDASSANNVLQFIESTLHHLGSKTVGLLRADSGFYDQAVFKLLEGEGINYIISAKLTQRLQQAVIRNAQWFALETGLELAEITYQASSWDTARRIVVIRQSIKRKNAPGKTLSLFADDPDIQGWRYGAMVTSLSLPTVEIWRSYRGRADCENRIKELKNDFGLDSFNLNSFYATEAALGFAMLAYNLMSTFRQAVMRAKIQPTLATLHQQVLAVGAFWNRDTNQNQLLLAVSRRRRAWFEGLWANAGDPPVLPVQAKIG